MDKILKEELHVDGLEYLGSAFGFDAYNATTYEGAQQLVLDGDTGIHAGERWAKSEAVFNAHINNTTLLCFFTAAGTNRVKYAFLTNPASTLTLKRGDLFVTKVTANYQVKDTKGADTIQNEVVPLYLLPNFSCSLDEYKGLVFGANPDSPKTSIIGNYPGVVNPNDAESITLPQECRAVQGWAFLDYPVRNIIIPASLSNVDVNAFYRYSGNVYLPFTEEEGVPPTWPVNWAHDIPNTNIHWASSNVSKNDLVVDMPKEERFRLINRLPVTDVLYYKNTKDGIVITGCRQGRRKLEIPEEIDGRPVIAVEQFAFYGDPFLERVVLPYSTKEVGKGAFMNCSNCRVYIPSKAVKYANATKNTAGSYARGELY